MHVGMDSPASSQGFPSHAPVVSGALAALGATLLAAAVAWLATRSSHLDAAPRPRRAALSAQPAPLPTPGPSLLTPSPLPRLLSDTGYRAAGVLEYAPQYPLWSDGAAKRRFVLIPEGEAIDGSDPDAWRFPTGTRFWKEFSFGERVETRFAEKLSDGSLRFAAYLWDSALGDAVLAPETGKPAAHAIAPGVTHDVPSRADCRACHEGRPSQVLGFNALQLSPARDPLAPHAEPPPPGAVDLPGLVARGLLRHFPEALLATPPRIAAKSATARAAQGYLLGNCSGCHNRTGPLASLGLDFDQSLTAPSTPSSLGQRSHFQLPGATSSLRMAPGHPRQSVVWFRMSVRGAAQMPPLGSKLVDRAGLDLVARYIASSSASPTPPEGETP
jgi:mono/diheme cytochrome c family protein